MLLLQESSRLLSEENGYVHLRKLQKMLRKRQQYMTSQISMLYPVKILVGPGQEQELEAYPLGSLAGNEQLNNSLFSMWVVPLYWMVQSLSLNFLLAPWIQFFLKLGCCVERVSFILYFICLMFVLHVLFFSLMLLHQY